MVRMDTHRGSSNNDLYVPTLRGRRHTIMHRVTQTKKDIIDNTTYIHIFPIPERCRLRSDGHRVLLGQTGRRNEGLCKGEDGRYDDGGNDEGAHDFVCLLGL